MNKIITTVAIVAILLIAGWYVFTNANLSGGDKVGADPQNATYIINNETFTLVDGLSEKQVGEDSTTQIVTRYFGNEVRIDLNDDDREDAVFLLTQEAGGSGTFFYVVAALNTEDGWQGSHALFLGDRIAPQTTEVSNNPRHKNVVVVNYADREAGEPMSAQPSVGKSIWIKLDPQSMQFGEVVQHFEGEANPDMMTLDMQTWRWIKAIYNNDTELAPNDAEAFTITFREGKAFSATTDCNNLSGTYEVQGSKITFGENIAMTKKFCKDSQEQEFASLFGEIQSFFFTSRGELVFELKFDSGSVIFR